VQVITGGGRDFSWVWIIVFVILLWPVAIIYYFTRKKNTLAVSITKREDGCSISATSSGKKSCGRQNIQGDKAQAFTQILLL
jgi:hypothetical protein